MEDGDDDTPISWKPLGAVVGEIADRLNRGRLARIESEQAGVTVRHTHAGETRRGQTGTAGDGKRIDWPPGVHLLTPRMNDDAGGSPDQHGDAGFVHVPAREISRGGENAAINHTYGGAIQCEGTNIQRGAEDATNVFVKVGDHLGTPMMQPEARADSHAQGEADPEPGTPRNNGLLPYDRSTYEDQADPEAVPTAHGNIPDQTKADIDLVLKAPERD